ncbi:23S rRNA (uracil(1939)-C(5))-methyltransferase RlmD [Geofilum rhodophaeum]|uniref:23S rRNA (uracil(1939)-C(5))-methyltransferase RlmD n=1 Tax=Geofilum rhodophaeum TaxID=1965019 RepID=UPI000B5219A0|nr:23S rRNA (uracil(1939)-C(5))-methyltransferase RlmD [Geofilum rhodophaeum]
MGRSRRNKPLLERLVVTDVAAEGKAMGKVDDKVVFVTQAVPGDIVDVQVNKKRRSYYEGFPVKFHHYSDLRVEPFCAHFGVCGGCKWQSLPYAEQLKFKEREVVNNLQRIGKVELPEVQSIMGSPAERFYRNKLEFTFSNKRWLSLEEMEREEEVKNKNGLGFHIPGMFDKVVDIAQCHLMAEPSNAIRNALREYALANALPFYDLRAKAGLLRTLMIRNTSLGEVMVVLSLFQEDESARKALFDHLIGLFPDVTSWMYVINPKANDTIGDLDIQLYAGRDHIFEEMEGLKFKIGPKSFFQTNSEQALHLYQVAREFAGLSGKEVVYDLYTGTGTIANFVARQAAKVVGIEYVPEAIEDAVVNAKINQIDNTVFMAGDMKDLLTAELFEEHGRPDVIITDPPRAGMHADVVQTILNAAPDKIVYVSCNSATQARDLQLLDLRYRVTRVQPVDMFPHTHHVENVVLLERR